ncbi:MAG TPA: FKBP-type peptidyl-prolyl cis-trans isomerase [Spirochaetales bacterium]|nr:FKBP-type peptidyl-prolyl cis-trans isomerase [Spirochaetales bacterium]HPG86408.1 FKBP-type peptidyl-prolyl cis-trans isomerase [Spirochaetales bacterium]
MKKTIVAFAAIAALSFSLVSCADKADSAKDAAASAADASYAFGLAIGTSLKDTGVELDYDEFLKGMKDYIEDREPRMSMETAQMTIQSAIMQAMQAIASRNAEAEAAFLAENGKKSGVTTTASGLQYEVIKLGSGPKPAESDTVRVDYVGTFLDGKEFDSSKNAGEPVVFPVAMVIPGWVEGLQLMPVGSKYKFYIPSALAYGEQGSQGGIEPNKTLVFEVELLGIEAAAQ